jgi:hypothetical protein
MATTIASIMLLLFGSWTFGLTVQPFRSRWLDDGARWAWAGIFIVCGLLPFAFGAYLAINHGGTLIVAIPLCLIVGIYAGERVTYNLTLTEAQHEEFQSLSEHN